MTCSKCGSGVKYREGTKGDRAWKGYFCLNQDCKNVDWIRDEKPKVNDTNTALLKRIADGIEEIVSILEKKKSEEPFK